MKRIAFAFALALVLPLFGAAVHAQTVMPKIGYTDYEFIIVRMPAYQTVQEQLEQTAQQDRQELMELEQGFQTKLAEYQQKQSIMNEETRQAREQELVQLQQDLQRQQQTRIQALDQRQAELLQPLFDKLQGAIDAVAQEQDLALVMTTRAGSEPIILYAGNSTVDITQQVMDRLGISATAPASTEGVD